MPVIDTSVLLCGLAFPDSYSGEFFKKVKEKQVVGVVSNTIKDEAIEISRSKAPEIEKKVNEFVANHAKYISISEKDIKGLRFTTSDRKDDHVIATAIVAKEDIIYTLDLGFFSEKMKNVSKEYGIQPQFPSFELYHKNPLEDIVDLPNYKPPLTSSKGSITLFLTTTWDSVERRHIKKRWYVMDAKDIFGLWYETHKQAFKFLPYPLGNEYIRHIPMTFAEQQHIRFTVTFDAWKGFSIYIDNKERHCNKKWKPILETRNINIGSSSNGLDHINGLFSGMHVFSEYLPQRIVRIMHEFDILIVSDKDLEITQTNKWMLKRGSQ